MSISFIVIGLLDKSGQAAVLASGKNWHEARANAATLRKQGLAVEIWREDGVKVPELEIYSNAN